jgi:hypothetical protein
MQLNPGGVHPILFGIFVTKGIKNRRVCQKTILKIRPCENEEPQKNQKRNGVKRFHFGETEGYVFSVASCSEGKGNFLSLGKRATEKRKCQGFCFTNRISTPITESSLVGQMDLLKLIQNEGEEAKGE